MPKPAPHRVAVLAFDGLVAGDLAMPCEIFQLAETLDGGLPYQVDVCASRPRVKTHAYDLHVRARLDVARAADTVVIPGLADPRQDIPKDIVDVVRHAHSAGARIASICTGAFVLAASGILDGLKATTHWKAADLLAQRYPKIQVNPNVLFVDNGQVLTSAGAAAGMDLCLHMIKRDHGTAVAANSARLAVVPLERAGGQAQFIVRPTPTSHTDLTQLLHWIEGRLGENLTVRALADQAAVSVRTLNRRFQELLGVSPLQWVIQARVNRARGMLETTDLPVERVAMEVGFGSAVSLREHFLGIVGTSPMMYRRAFRKVG
ncbi:HTH-type transcriptional regulator CdhR [Achromobacter deleyi]|uniref:HTH-type transcriptional regulator CdhR n=1 Tax=Achromobacter deleyi TaxID=1353891 RepID=A0A6S6ZL89_9BURK|nr:helix-turn-helix domain-containing protein [Achromobacter deleyi]CAB3683697.1 HTH-type transcriptional regulator CdhR [Achromobacter deleyi]CAB3923513.1 HTH-type transcriptional regulator CdhR [Achromobacter deleyi]CAB3924571.1 HTH-type transcriptional regulator CdhR [Achromobacter deleyi]